MKGQDLAILLKLSLLERGENFNVSDLAYELCISQGEASKAIKRLIETGLLDAKDKRPLKKQLMNLIEYGVKYFFSTRPGRIVRGIETAHSAQPLSNMIISDSKYVWPEPDGDIRGEEITPLYAGAARAALKDKNFYELLALVDAVRVGKAREEKLAIKELKGRMINE